MKRLIAVIFLSAFLFSGTEAHELFKIPHLISHYVEHSKEKISLLDFLEEHYDGQEKHGVDGHKDKGCLPFQGKDHINPLNLYIIHSTSAIVLQKLAPVSNESIFLEENIISSFNGSIWLPPKLA